MKLSDITTKEDAAYQLVQAQRRLAAAQEDCQMLERRLIELESQPPTDAIDQPAEAKVA